MGRTKNGVLGTVTGKVSKVVYYDLKGQEVVRTLGVKKGITSTAVLAQNDRMTILMAFFRKVKPFIKAGFKNEAVGTLFNFHNIATAYNIVHAMTDLEGIPAIQYDRVLLSRGTAHAPQSPQAVRNDSGLTFSWDNDPDLPWGINQDQVMMLAWFPEIDEALYNIAGAVRSSGSDHLLLPVSFRTLRMETYIAFVAEDRESVSKSMYLGSIN